MSCSSSETLSFFPSRHLGLLCSQNILSLSRSLSISILCSNHGPPASWPSCTRNVLAPPPEADFCISVYQPRFQPTREGLLLICYPIRALRPWIFLMRHPFLGAARMVLAADSRIPMQGSTGTRMSLSRSLTSPVKGTRAASKLPRIPAVAHGGQRTNASTTSSRLESPSADGRKRKELPVCRELLDRAGIARAFKRSQSALQGGNPATDA